MAALPDFVNIMVELWSGAVDDVDVDVDDEEEGVVVVDS